MRVEIPHGIGLKDARDIIAAWRHAGISHLLPAYPGVPVALAEIELHKTKFSGTGTPARGVKGKHTVRSRRIARAKGQAGARFLRKQRKENEE